MFILQYVGKHGAEFAKWSLHGKKTLPVFSKRLQAMHFRRDSSLPRRTGQGRLRISERNEVKFPGVLEKAISSGFTHCAVDPKLSGEPDYAEHRHAKTWLREIWTKSEEVRRASARWR